MLAAADLAPRPIEYQTTAISDTAYILLQILRAIPNSIMQMFQNK